MFRPTARDTHAWQDVLKNIGKLSLAGIFVAGTVFVSQVAEAVPPDQMPAQQAISR